MPGETMDIGTVRARNVQDMDYTKKYPGYRICLVSKSDKASPGLTQVQAYANDGWAFLEDSPHPDLAVYGLSEEEAAAKDAEEAVLKGDTGGVTSSNDRPLSRKDIQAYGSPVMPSQED